MFYDDGGEAMAQAALKSCGCPTPGDVQSQVEWRLEKPDLMLMSNRFGT